MRLGQMVGAEPFSMIFGEIVGMEPLAGGVAPAAAALDPPFPAILEIDRAKCPYIAFENIMLITIGEHRDEGFGVAVGALMIGAEDGVIGEAIVAPLFR